MLHLVLRYISLYELSSGVPASFEADFLCEFVDLAQAVGVCRGSNLIKIVATLVLCSTVIGMDNIVINLWLTYALTFLVVELNKVN